MRRLALGLGALLAIGGCKASDAGAPGSGGSSRSGSGGQSAGSGGNKSGSGGGSGSGGSSSGSGGNGSSSGGSTGSGGSPTMAVSCSSAPLGSPALRLMTRTEMQNTLGDVFPQVKSQWSASLPANNISAFGFDNDQSSTVGTQLASAVLDMATSVATAVTASGVLSSLLPCSTAAADHACAETFLNQYGPKLFRRAITSSEHDNYLAFFDASKGKSDFPTALKWMIVALVQSPNALYRSEIGTDMGDGTRKLTAYEQVTELAYNYTGTTPTDAMLQMAASGSLGDLTAMAKSLLATDQGKQMVQHFFEQYFDYANVTSLDKPNISSFSQISDDMLNETYAFIDNVVIQNGGGMKELLTSNTTNPSKALAAYYATGNAYTGGFPTPSSDYATVTRPTGLGVGILAQGAFLAVHASATNDSPTRRGLIPFQKLFCKTKPTPPPNVPALDTTTPMANVNTTRDRYELVHELTQGATGPCAVCHKLFDPIGFGFEHFDEGGRYRTKEGTYDVNSAATAVAADGSSMSFTDEESLMSDLVGQSTIHDCMSAYLATYAFGTNDACLGSSQSADLESGKIGFLEAFARLVTEPHFTQRNASQ